MNAPADAGGSSADRAHGAAALPHAVAAVVRLVPAGRVVSYGDIAALFEVNPRQVGHVMATHNDPDLPWWRVTNAAGLLPGELLPRALPRWRTEGTPVRGDGLGVVIGRARADLAALGDAAEDRLGPLPGLH